MNSSPSPESTPTPSRPCPPVQPHPAFAAARLAVVLLLGLLPPVTTASAQAAAADGPQGNAGDATDGVVWGALVYATDGEAPDAAAPAPEQRERFNKVVPRLKKAFDFKSFHLLGQHTQEIFSAYESWVVPSDDLFLRIDSKGPAEGGGINLHLQVWQRQRVLVKTDAVLRPGSPLFIRGPNWRNGSLIFVVLTD